LSTHYQLNVLQNQGWNRIQVLKPISDTRQELVWECELEGCDDWIILQAFFDPEGFVIADDRGRVFVGDITQRECRQVVHEHSMGCGAWLDRENREFWHALGEPAGAVNASPTLVCRDLDSWRQLQAFELPEYNRNDTMVRRCDGCFVFYHHDYDSLEEGEHGFYCLDPNTGETQYHSLPSKPVPDSSYLNKNMAVCGSRNLAAIPAADEVRVSSDKEGRPIFNYQIQLVDLNRFTILWCKTVRPMRTEEIVCFNHDHQELEEGLLRIASGQEEDGDDEHWLELVDRLNSIVFCDDEDALWLCWSGGVLRRVSLDGESLSPLYVMKSAGENPSLQDALSYRTFHTKLRGVRPGRLLLSYSRYYEIDLSIPREGAAPGYEWLIYRNAPSPEVVISDALRQEMAAMGRIQIEVSDLKSEKGVIDALTRMELLLRDIGNTAKGNRLIFLFADAAGRQWSESECLFSAVNYEEGAELAAECVRHFNAYKEAWRLRGRDDKPALADAVLALAGCRMSFLPLLADYFKVIDGEHCDVFHMKNTLPLIRRKYYGNRALKKFLKAVPYPFNGKRR